MEYINNVLDNTHKASGNLRYQHDFGKWGNISIFTQGFYYNSKTKYSGTSSSDERLTLFRIGPGISYSYFSDKFYGSVGVGFSCDRTKTGYIIEKYKHPWTDFSVQYSFNNKNSVTAEFHYATKFRIFQYAVL